MGMTTAVGKYAGVNSAAFALALIFSFVVMYDAAGLRRAAGRQAAILEQALSKNLVNNARRQEAKASSSFFGHTPVEVLVGAVIGVVAGLIL